MIPTAPASLAYPAPLLPEIVAFIHALAIKAAREDHARGENAGDGAIQSDG
jgi:hypothetical protein